MQKKLVNRFNSACSVLDSIFATLHGLPLPTMQSPSASNLRRAHSELIIGTPRTNAMQPSNSTLLLSQHNLGEATVRPAASSTRVSRRNGPVILPESPPALESSSQLQQSSSAASLSWWPASQPPPGQMNMTAVRGGSAGLRAAAAVRARRGPSVMLEQQQQQQQAQQQQTQQRMRSAGSIRMRSASSSSTRYSGSSQYSLSPTQEFEAAEFEMHLGQRSELLSRMSTKRLAAQRRALERKEVYWTNRRRAEHNAAMVRRVCAEALAEPITFLPRLPEAAELAKRSWAWDQIDEEGERRKATQPLGSETEVEESKRLVEALSDDMGTLSTVINAWTRPDMKKQWVTSMKGRTMEGKGMSPQSRHFRAISNVLPDVSLVEFAPASGPAF